MTTLPDLEALERDAFRRFYEDGLLDVFFGLMLMTMAVGSVLNEVFESEWQGLIGMLVIALVLVVWTQLQRRRLLRSRLGSFVPGPERRRKITMTRVALLASVALGLVLAILVSAIYSDTITVTDIEIIMPAVWFVNAVLVLGAMAYFLDVPRLYFYGFLFGSAMPLLILPDVLWDIEIPAWVAFGAPGLIMVIIGLVLLKRFLAAHPPLEREDGGAGR